MMKIWLIRHYGIEMEMVIAVCTELEIAQQIMVGLREPESGSDYVIEEWETNMAADNVSVGIEVDARRGKPLFDWA